MSSFVAPSCCLRPSYADFAAATIALPLSCCWLACASACAALSLAALRSDCLFSPQTSRPTTAIASAMLAHSQTLWCFFGCSPAGGVPAPSGGGAGGGSGGGVVWPGGCAVAIAQSSPRPARGGNPARRCPAVVLATRAAPGQLSGGGRHGLVVGHGGGRRARGGLAAAQRELPDLRDGDDGQSGADADQPLVAGELL